MTWGYWGRTAEQVQRDNGIRYDFDTLKAKYESVKPLRGKRKQLDVRPLSQRNRSWERVVKVDENEYYLTCFGYAYMEVQNPDYKPNRAITFIRCSDHDLCTVHTPRSYWNDVDNNLYPRMLEAPSTFYFYAMNLPEGISMSKVNHRGYLTQYKDNKPLYYTLDKGDVVFSKKHGEKEWKPLMVHREVVHYIDRAKTKELRELVKPFYQYCLNMIDIVEPKWDYGSIIQKAMQEVGLKSHNECVELFKHDGDEVPEHWFNMMSRFKHKIQGWKNMQQVYDKSVLFERIYRDLYSVAKPCKEVEVPLGVACKDRYAQWYR